MNADMKNFRRFYQRILPTTVGLAGTGTIAATHGGHGPEHLLCLSFPLIAGLLGSFWIRYLSQRQIPGFGKDAYEDLETGAAVECERCHYVQSNPLSRKLLSPEERRTASVRVKD